jgi:hypothetical protein
MDNSHIVREQQERESGGLFGDFSTYNHINVEAQ